MGFGHEKKPSSLLKLSSCKSCARLAVCFMEYAASLGFITAVTTNGANFAHFPRKQLFLRVLRASIGIVWGQVDWSGEIYHSVYVCVCVCVCVCV